jgi:hypothetical protein
MRHPNCLASFFGRDSNSCVALVARKYGRSAGVSRAVSARFSEGGSIRVLFSSHFVVPVAVQTQITANGTTEPVAWMWMCNEMNLRVLMPIRLLKPRLTKSATTNNTYYEGIKHSGFTSAIATLDSWPRGGIAREPKH